MRIGTMRFGELEIENTRVITFPKGILGFEENKKFVLLPVDEKGETPFFFLQSTESKEVEFFLLDTLSFFKEFEIKLEDAVVEKLEIELPQDVLVLTTITVRGSIKDATTNLKAPLVINQNKQLGMQVLLHNDLMIKQPLFKGEQKAPVGQV